MPIKVNDRGFIYATEGHWYPPLNIKQFEIFVDTHRYLLVHGPRKSGKTFGILHKVLRHAFDTKGAMVAIVCKTIKNAKAAGVWVLLGRMIKIWEEALPGQFVTVEGPKTTGDSKMSYVRIRNRHGTISEIQCHSLEHSAEVEAKFKGPAYSMFWLSEFDQYCDEHAFDIFSDALRMWEIPYEQHQIVCDCNPPDTGTNNWIHDKWFKFKDESPKDGEMAEEGALRDSLHRILVNLDDNPQLDIRERKDIEARYRRRKTLFNRFILGIWEMDVTDGHFSDVWNDDIHIVGNADGPKDEWEIMTPTAHCKELITGWDIGEAKNHSFHIMEKLVTEDPTNKRMQLSFHVLDELVVVRTFISVAQFVEEALRKMEFWEKYQFTTNKLPISWRHWSDTSAFDKRSAANASDAAIAFEASGHKIVLHGAPKYRDSNRDKVNLIWQLLYAKRLLVSAQLVRTRAMFAMLRADPKSTSAYVKRDDHKHPFDSLSYPIIAEAPADMLRGADVEVARLEASPRPVFAGF